METQIIVPQSFIQQKLKDVFNSEFTKVVSESIDSGIQEFQKQFIDIDKAKDKYYSELSDAKHTDYPQPIEYQGDFKFCGQCMKCREKDSKMEYYDSIYKRVLSKGIHIEYTDNGTPEAYQTCLLSGEYALMCSLVEENHVNSSNPSGKMFTNYGRIVYYHIGGCYSIKHNLYVCQNDAEGSGFYYHLNEGASHPNFQTPKYLKINQQLSGEYCEILGAIDFVLGVKQPLRFNAPLFCRITDIYKKYHPKASEICKIEMKQKELKQMMRDLQEQEMKYGTRMKELTEYNVTLDEQTKQLQKNQQVHKDKLKNLFQREKAVKMKETLHGCKEELKDIALQLNDMYVLTDSPDEAIQTQLNDILGRLNTLYAEPIQPTIMAQTL